MAKHESTAAAWAARITAWRASGLTAEAFAQREGYAVGTLRVWSSRLGRGRAASTMALARVVRTAPRSVGADGAMSIVLDVLGTGVRLTVGATVERATLAMVLDVLDERTAR